QHWEPDRRKQTTNLVATQLAAQYMHMAAQLQKQLQQIEDELKKNETQLVISELLKRAGSLRFKNKINNILDLASKQPTLALTGEEWEPNPMVLAVKNGVIDLKTGHFRQGRPSDYIRTFAPVEWQ